MAELDIVSANEAFYAAFRDDDLAAMDRVWAQRAPVACVHPGWPPLIGREQVMASWRAILGNGAPAIRCGVARVLMLGEVAEVVCEEHVGDDRVIATNVFVKEDGRWAMVHHHGSHLVPRGLRLDDPDSDDDDADDADEDTSTGEPPLGPN
jgi:ketosteroid isomerase-like protein